MKFRLAFLPKTGQKYEVFDESNHAWGGRYLVEVIQQDARYPRKRFTCKILEAPLSLDVGREHSFKIEQFFEYKNIIGVFEI